MLTLAGTGGRLMQPLGFSENNSRTDGPIVAKFGIGTVNRGYFERFLYSTLNTFFINCSTDINPAPYLGLYMGPSSFTLKKKLAPLTFLIF